MHASLAPRAPRSYAEWIAHQATAALVAEAMLTPKPGLVDQRGSGAHHDLDLALMLRSAHALQPAFYALAEASLQQQIGPALRESIGRIGRDGERAMLSATAGVNTHRGAIWAVGLLVAAAALAPDDHSPRGLVQRAGELARLPDQHQPVTESKGQKACLKHGVPGARGEAQADFPHIMELGLPTLRCSRAAGEAETSARLNALLSIMSRLPDTCVLSRGGSVALTEAQAGAYAVLAAGGAGTLAGRRALQALEASLLARNASPGGAADLLAATLFIDSVDQQLDF